MMEIVLKGSTKIVMSPKKFDFANIVVDEDITLLTSNQRECMIVYQYV